jgi:hypothetical protein
VSERCSRRQTSGTFGRFSRPYPACRRKPTICSALRRVFIREPFQAPGGARGFSHKTWIRIWGGRHIPPPGEGLHIRHRQPIDRAGPAADDPLQGLQHQRLMRCPVDSVAVTRTRDYRPRPTPQSVGVRPPLCAMPPKRASPSQLPPQQLTAIPRKRHRLAGNPYHRIRSH